MTTAKPILPKLQPHPAPIYLVPVTLTPFVAVRNPVQNADQAETLRATTSPAQTVGNAPPPAPPPPPPSLLSRSRRRVPILIDQRSLKKNLQSNKQSLQNKLARRPEQRQLIERGILRTEGAEQRQSHQREALRRRIERRPPREELVTQRILLSDAGVDPLVQVRGQLLKRNKLADNLNNKLRKRPGPLELVTRKILQVDAELEQAIQEGRLPFTPTTSPTLPQTQISFPEDDTGMISALSAPSNYDDVLSTQISHSSQSPPLLAAGPKAKVRKKSQQLHRNATPYDSNCMAGGKLVKLKAALSNGKRTSNEPVGSNSVSPPLPTEFGGAVVPMETDDADVVATSDTNYEITLKQQQIFLQWQEERHKTPNPMEVNAVTPAMSSTTSNCSTPLQSNDAQSTHSTRSSFSVSSNHSASQGTTRFSSVYSPDASPTSGDNLHAHSSAATDLLEKPRSRLADFKVQDLKNECKKRQLPVSGAKPQLLDRLKPYEDIILSSAPAVSIVSSSSSTTLSAESMESTHLPTSSYQTACHRPNVMTASNFCQSASKTTVPAQDVIHEYLQQCQPQPQKPLVFQIPANTKAPQVVQLIDSNGSVVGMAAMPTAVTSKQAVPCCCSQCKLPRATTMQSVTDSMASEAKTVEPTFSFSQMGSGGQFTLANSATILADCHPMAPNCVGCIAAASQSAMKIVTSELASSGLTRATTQPIMVPRNSASPVTICASTPLVRSNTNTMASMKRPVLPIQKADVHASSVDQTVAAVAHRRHSIATPSVPQTEDATVTGDAAMDADDRSHQENGTENFKGSGDNEDELDEMDPSVLLTAKTFSQHEDTLRQQQRRIEELQQELAKSQEALRREQKLIIAAKKKQLQLDQQTGKNLTPSEILLNNLDVKNLNKLHIQHFLQHKAQHQNLQNQSQNYQQLAQVEHKIQEEMHIEQAVQDIVRLIKQDGRTALLIVQLLRRYQLERNHQLQQVVAAQTIPQASKPPKADAHRHSPVLTVPVSDGFGHSPSLPPKGDGCCSRPTNANCHQCVPVTVSQPTQVVVIDDSPAQSPMIGGDKELLPKDLPPRSRSQNSKTIKRKTPTTRSIWSRPHVVEKSASFTNAPVTSGSNKVDVDMEEIFRTVIASGGPKPMDASTTVMVNNYVSQQMTTHMDASSELVPQLNGFHLVSNSDESSNSGLPDDAHDMTAEYVHQYHHQEPTEICSTTAVFTQPENTSSCHVECYSKPANENSPERVQIVGNQQEYIPSVTIGSNSHNFDYSPNEDFDDLMDVLRDDQEGTTTNVQDDSGRELLGYTPGDLATFLASEYESGVRQGDIFSGYGSGVSHGVTAHYDQNGCQQPMGMVNHGGRYENVEYDQDGNMLMQSIEPHQEQAIDDLLNGDMLEPSVEWFDNFLQEPAADRQISYGGRQTSQASLQRPMDAYV